jgi:hypothetical protein
MSLSGLCSPHYQKQNESKNAQKFHADPSEIENNRQKVRLKPPVLHRSTENHLWCSGSALRDLRSTDIDSGILFHYFACNFLV